MVAMEVSSSISTFLTPRCQYIMFVTLYVNNNMFIAEYMQVQRMCTNTREMDISKDGKNKEAELSLNFVVWYLRNKTKIRRSSQRES